MKERKQRSTEAKTIAAYIDNQIDWVDKTAVQIAEEVGFPKPNILSMIRSGKTKLPIARIPKMAKALEVDPVFLLDMAMREYDPETWTVIKSLVGRPAVSNNQYELLEVIREARPGEDFKVTENNKEKIMEFFKSL
jgi:transcriptional regulator with XRE-family HTH domain